MGSKDAPQKMQFLGATQKVASPCALIQNTKTVENPHRFGCHRSKIGPNPKVLAYIIPRAHEQGQICIYGFVSKLCLGKVIAFLKSHPCGQETGE